MLKDYFEKIQKDLVEREFLSKGHYLSEACNALFFDIDALCWDKKNKNMSFAMREIRDLRRYAKLIGERIILLENSVFVYNEAITPVEVEKEQTFYDVEVEERVLTNRAVFNKCKNHSEFLLLLPNYYLLLILITENGNRVRAYYGKLFGLRKDLDLAGLYDIHYSNFNMAKIFFEYSDVVIKVISGFKKCKKIIMELKDYYDERIVRKLEEFFGG